MLREACAAFRVLEGRCGSVKRKTARPRAHLVAETRRRAAQQISDATLVLSACVGRRRVFSEAIGPNDMFLHFVLEVSAERRRLTCNLSDQCREKKSCRMYGNIPWYEWELNLAARSSSLRCVLPYGVRCSQRPFAREFLGKRSLLEDADYRFDTHLR